MDKGPGSGRFPMRFNSAKLVNLEVEFANYYGR